MWSLQNALHLCHFPVCCFCTGFCICAIFHFCNCFCIGAFFSAISVTSGAAARKQRGSLPRRQSHLAHPSGRAAPANYPFPLSPLHLLIPSPVHPYSLTPLLPTPLQLPTSVPFSATSLAIPYFISIEDTPILSPNGNYIVSYLYKISIKKLCYRF